MDRLPRFVAAVSIDGLPEHHNVRRHPATYERILATRRAPREYSLDDHCADAGAARLSRRVCPLLECASEVRNIWVSLYSPQRGEQSAECLTSAQREQVARELPRLRALYPKLLTPKGYAQALLNPPKSPEGVRLLAALEEFFRRLKTHVEPCVFGGDPDCSQCGCSASAATHWISGISVVGPLKSQASAARIDAIGSASGAVAEGGSARMARTQPALLRSRKPNWCKSRWMTQASNSCVSR